MDTSNQIQTNTIVGEPETHIETQFSTLLSTLSQFKTQIMTLAAKTFY